MLTLVNKTVQLGYDLKVSCDIVCFGQFISLTYQTANIYRYRCKCVERIDLNIKLLMQIQNSSFFIRLNAFKIIPQLKANKQKTGLSSLRDVFTVFGLLFGTKICQLNVRSSAIYKRLFVFTCSLCAMFILHCDLEVLNLKAMRIYFNYFSIWTECARK